MKSPFPGMDPYLERHWLDVHATLAVLARAELNRRLPEDLVASVEEREAVEIESEETEGVVGPDVRVAGRPLEPSLDAPTAVAAPYRLLALEEPALERFVKIIETGSERLITVIEFISPSNKLGAGLAEFRRKRRALLASGVSVVEIDLVRRGDWRRLMAPARPDPSTETEYRACVRVAGDPACLFYFPLPLRVPLGTVSVPLRRGDPELGLDLQTLLETAYTEGRYARRIDYSKPPDPPLSPDDAAWAATLAAR